MNRFKNRSQEAELMDDLDCTGPVVERTLHELEVINTWLGGNSVTISGLKKLIATNHRHEEVHIADLGCGGGDVLKRMYDWGRRNRYSFRLTGIDANPNIIALARSKFAEMPATEFQAVNIFSDAFKAMRFDVVVGTLFFHHFSSEELVGLFRQLHRQVRIGIVINDIHRHWLAFHSIRLLTRYFSRSPMVQTDAPLSVLRAFSRNDLEDILKRAGISNYQISWWWAFRWQVVIRV